MDNTPLFSDPPPPYSMCSRDECEARQSSGEISLLERQRAAPICGSQQDHLVLHLCHHRRNRHNQLLDPRLAVAKYRRAAAGVTTDSLPPTRSMEQLYVTVTYLVHVLVAASDSSSDGITPIDSWLRTTVQFVQDRFRAIQVDLIRSSAAVTKSKSLQVIMARTHLLLNYLLADEPLFYELKFGHDAVQTCLVNYWNDPAESPQHDDEILSYILLLSWHPHNGNSDETTTSMNMSSFYQIYNRHFATKTQRDRSHDNKKDSDWPLLQWTLRLVVTLELGHWQTALAQLDRSSIAGDDDHHQEACSNVGILTAAAEFNFCVLARSILAPHLPWIRFQTLDAYNRTWQKGQLVAADEIARLLCLRGSTSGSDTGEMMALTFGKSIGLLEEEGKLLRFKAGPSLQPAPDQQKCRDRSRENDAFVCRYAPENVRRDKTGLLIPPQDWMRQLLLG
jgi:hypothetical protein